MNGKQTHSASEAETYESICCALLLMQNSSKRYIRTNPNTEGGRVASFSLTRKRCSHAYYVTHCLSLGCAPNSSLAKCTLSHPFIWLGIDDVRCVVCTIINTLVILLAHRRNGRNGQRPKTWKQLRNVDHDVDRKSTSSHVQILQIQCWCSTEYRTWITNARRLTGIVKPLSNEYTHWNKQSVRFLRCWITERITISMVLHWNWFYILQTRVRVWCSGALQCRTGTDDDSCAIVCALQVRWHSGRSDGMCWNNIQCWVAWFQDCIQKQIVKYVRIAYTRQ